MVDGDATRVLLCRLSWHLVGLPIEHVIETMRPLPVEAMTGAPPYVTGLAVIRGVPVPVVDAAVLLDERSTSPGRFVTVRAANRTVALAVDGVVGVRTIQNTSLERLPPLLREGAGAVAAIGILDAALFLVLDSARIVPDAGPLSPDTNGTAS